MAAFLFAYGSLLSLPGARPWPPRSRLCRLRSHRRVWNVAMDNRATLPGYKYYRDPSNGGRPEVFVAFLDLVPRDDSIVNGVVVAVTRDELSELDQRERNYHRRTVTDEIELALDGPVWAYFGTDAARQRYATAARRGCAVVSREYRDGVLDGFRLAGPEARAEFEATTDPPSCPVVELERVDVPPVP